MITLEQLKELANKMEDKSIEAKQNNDLTTAFAFITASAEIWKFINEEQLKQLS